MNTADKWSQFNALPSWERKGVDEMAIKVGHTLHAGSSAEQIAWAIGYYKGVRPLSGWPA